MRKPYVVESTLQDYKGLLGEREREREREREPATF
jgi:hypothetical protein